jgi:hypothetical protein
MAGLPGAYETYTVTNLQLSSDRFTDMVYTDVLARPYSLFYRAFHWRDRWGTQK